MLAIAVRGCEVSPLSLAEAYTLFPNNGNQVSHTPFAAVYRDGVRIQLPPPSHERINASESAYVVTQMMPQFSAGGTASGALGLAGLPGSAPISGKTGFGEGRRSLVRGILEGLVVAVCRYAQ